MRCDASQDEAKAKADAEAKAAAEAKAKEEAEKAKKDDTEGRISALAEQNKELKKQLKAIEDAKKAEEDEKAKKKGDFEKLLTDRETELATERKAREDYEAKVKKYEELATKQIQESLKSIADADKKKSAEAMLAGRSTDEQIALLPEVMKLAGVSAATTFGGATLASTTTAQKTDVAQKRARYSELLGKANKTPPERAEQNKLMLELQAVWNKEQEEKRAL